MAFSPWYAASVCTVGVGPADPPLSAQVPNYLSADMTPGDLVEVDSR